MFSMAYRLIKTHFYVDLEEAALANQECWANLSIRALNIFKKNLPLPTSNSVAAKQMRLVAILTILAYKLEQAIFQPSYLLSERDELSKLISGLIHEDHSRDSHLQAVLLSVDPVRQKELGRERIEHVVKCIIGYIKPLLSGERQKSFNSKLKTVCNKICEQWMSLQELKERIVAFRDPSQAPLEDWAVLNLPPTGDPEKRNRPSSNAASASASGSKLAKKDHTQMQKLQDRGSIVGIVWPCFLLFDENAEKPVKDGLVLTDTQIQAAQNESNSYRTARIVRRRTNSVQINGIEPGSGNSFLAPGGGNGENGG